MRNTNLSNIPFSDAERKYIRKYKDTMTSGAIADNLNKLYKEYNKGTRTADGVRAYKRELENTLIRVQIEMSRSLKDKIMDAGLDHVDVSMACEQGIRQALQQILKNRAQSTRAH